MNTAATIDNRPVVAHVRCVTGFGGGPEKTILNSPRFLAHQGYDSFCAYMHPPQDAGFETLRDRAAAANARLISIPDRGAWDWRVVTRLIRLCREHRVAIWHGHDYKSNVAGLIVRRFWPMHLVTTTHGWVDTSRRMPLYDKIDRWVLPYYREVMCVSEDLFEQCLALGIPPARCHLIKNGIDTDDFRRRLSSAEAKVKCGANPQRLLVGAVGRLAHEKGFDLLIQAVAQLIAKGMPVDLWIVGEGAARTELEQLIARTGQQAHIRLLGQITDPRAFFQSCDMFVLSSLREGLPNVVLEAMALEVPVIATRIAGVPALIGDGRTGLLIDPGAQDQIEMGITTLAQDPTLRSDLARAGRAVIEQSYSFVDRIAKEVAIYDQLLGRVKHQPEVNATSHKGQVAT